MEAKFYTTNHKIVVQEPLSVQVVQVDVTSSLCKRLTSFCVAQQLGIPEISCRFPQRHRWRRLVL
jgi:hypothetical protein